MHRTKIKELLSTYKQIFDEDTVILSRFKEFVESYKACFERTLSIGHITGSAWVIDKEREHVLFTYHKKLDMWLQLGGHCDGSSDVYSVALTEAKEESGLLQITPISMDIFDLDIHLIPESKSNPEHYHYDARFIFEANHADKLILSEESKDLRWVQLSEIENYTKEPSILRMARKTRE